MVSQKARGTPECSGRTDGESKGAKLAEETRMKNDTDERTYKELAKQKRAEAEMRSAGCVIVDYDTYKAHQRSEAWSTAGRVILVGVMWFIAGANWCFIKLVELGVIE